MKANLTYSLISADLKQGMYLLVNDHLGYVSRMNGDEVIISISKTVKSLSLLSKL